MRLHYHFLYIYACVHACVPRYRYTDPTYLPAELHTVEVVVVRYLYACTPQSLIGHAVGVWECAGRGLFLFVRRDFWFVFLAVKIDVDSGMVVMRDVYMCGMFTGWREAAFTEVGAHYSTSWFTTLALLVYIFFLFVGGCSTRDSILLLLPILLNACALFLPMFYMPTCPVALPSEPFRLNGSWGILSLMQVQSRSFGYFGILSSTATMITCIIHSLTPQTFAVSTAAWRALKALRLAAASW
ncbi:hypothetical protein KC337_g3 [Hortaea werneckii]|nr:hypothetical protein KC337_g3 [Hortaea werneckii]